MVQNLFLVYLSISICLGRLCVHHQEKQLCLCETWYLLFCVDDCLVCRSMCSCIPDGIKSTKCRTNTVSPDDGHIVSRNMQILFNKLRINILRINFAPCWLSLQNYVRVTTCNLKTEVDKYAEMPYVLDLLQVTESVKIRDL